MADDVKTRPGADTNLPSDRSRRAPPGSPSSRRRARCSSSDGYGATTLQGIADRASVSVATVYAAFGNKRTVLKELVDVSIAGDDEPVAIADRDLGRGPRC